MQAEGSAVSPCGDGEEEDVELSVLPKNTKVVVTGNNRTNSVLLGLHGTVKKAVGFGWHWLVLLHSFFFFFLLIPLLLFYQACIMLFLVVAGAH
jgi:hypothetical protein